MPQPEPNKSAKGGTVDSSTAVDDGHLHKSNSVRLLLSEVEQKRQEAIDEFITTEKTYVKRLMTAYDVDTFNKYFLNFIFHVFRYLFKGDGS